MGTTGIRLGCLTTFSCLVSLVSDHALTMASNAMNTEQLRDLFKKGKHMEIMHKIKTITSREELKQRPDQSIPLHYAASRGRMGAVKASNRNT